MACGPLEENTIFGQLLGINDFYQTYLEYVEQFHTIFSDQALLMEMQQFGDAMGEALEAEKMSHIQHFMESNLTNIAKLWSVFLEVPIEPHQVGVCMTLLKIARIKSIPENADHWEDSCGYMACGGELIAKKPSPLKATKFQGGNT